MEIRYKKLDYLSAILLIVGLVPFVLALQLDKEDFPWTSLVTISLFAVSLIGLTLFSLRSVYGKNPLLDFTLFKNKVFGVSVIALFFLGSSFMGLIIFLPLYLVNVTGVSATMAGISLIPLTLGVVFGSVIAGNLVSRFGHYKLWMLGGAFLLLIGTVLLTQLSADTNYSSVIFYMIICGVGIGPSMPLYTLAIQNAVQRHQLGQATSAGQFFRQIGGAVSTALMGTILSITLAQSFNHSTGQSAGNKLFGGDIKSTGTENLEEKIIEEYNIQFLIISKSLSENDPNKLKELNSSLLPAHVLTRIKRGEFTKSDLPDLKKYISEKGKETAYLFTKTIKNSFNLAITRIYWLTTILVAIALVVTLIIPEIPLK